MGSELDRAGVETRALLEAVDFRGARVLEIGSGDGRLTYRYANQADHVTGIDPDEAQVTRATEACPSSLRAHVEFLKAGATNLPFRDGTFDIALLAWSL